MQTKTQVGAGAAAGADRPPRHAEPSAVSLAEEVRRYLAGEPPLQIGMSAETNVVVAQRDAALLLPASAVADGQVWKVEGGRAVRHPVTVGVRAPDKVEIRGGLAEADAVIAAPPEGLEEGDRVAVRRQP